MIGVVASAASAAAGPLVVAALRRSSGGQLVQALPPHAIGSAPTVLVLIDPQPEWAAELDDWLGQAPRKLIVLGGLPDAVQDRLGIDSVVAPALDSLGAEAPPAAPHTTSISPLLVRYGPAANVLGARSWARPLRRFDFADEWNNLGFGAISIAGDIWSLGPPIRLLRGELATVVDAEGAVLASYCGLVDNSSSAVLWFNRPVGPIDSFEWRLVELFLSGYRAGDLPVVPVLAEAPAGHDLVVTMRLDCDEDIGSARPLFEAYRELGLPFSLAVKTGLLADGYDTALLDDVLSAGGSVLAHSVTHAPFWGGSAAAALKEAEQAAQMLQRAIGQRPRHAVSPFHQTPAFALAALQQCGYAGCIGGNISSDPAFNLARGGVPAGCIEPFVGQSQQCMLHGDCLLEGSEPMATFFEAVALAHQSRSLFGYLDHPFSPRYQYGWSDEAERITAHMALIDYIAAIAAAPLHLSADAALDLSALRSRTRIEREGEVFRVLAPELPEGMSALVLELGGREVPLPPGRPVELSA